MPSLHKRLRSPYWVASFQDARGRWLKKSTKTGDKRLALKLAMEWEKAAREGREGRFVETQARRVLSEIAEQATGSPLHFHTCRAWFEEWLAGKTTAKAERTVVKYRQVCEAFLAHLGTRADLPLAAISLADARGFRDVLFKEGRAPSTVNQAIRKVLSMPFEAARKLGYIAVNPCAGVDSLNDEKEVEKAAFTREQVALLLSTAEGDWKGAILAGLSTGRRLGDVARMQWGAIDLPNGIIMARAEKGKKLVPSIIRPEFAAWLAAQPPAIGKAPVFPTLAGLPGPGRNGLSKQFERIMKRAGIRGAIMRQGEGKGRTVRTLSFHSLRHTFNSELANAGVSQEIRQKLTGHASAAMNNRYTHLELATFKEAVAKLPTIPMTKEPRLCA